jgi:hypothetical protein
MKDDFREMMQSNLLKILVLLLRLASRILEVYQATLLFFRFTATQKFRIRNFCYP